MRQIWTVRGVEVAAKYGEHAPMATACCNACRTCATTNLIGLATAGVTAAWVAAAGLVRRAKPA